MYACVAGQVPSRGHTRGNHTLFLSSLSPSIPLSLKIKSLKKRLLQCELHRKQLTRGFHRKYSDQVKDAGCDENSGQLYCMRYKDGWSRSHNNVVCDLNQEGSSSNGSKAKRVPRSQYTILAVYEAPQGHFLPFHAQKGKKESDS